MAVRWQIPFRSLRRNALYTVNVYDENYTGSPSVLTGGAQPFVTEEDDSEDWFEPVRTQSGYISIVDTGEDAAGNAFNWRDFIPTTDTDRPVTLTDEGGTILWQGFMQAQNFGSQLYETPQERQFPVQCVLTVLSTKDVDTSERGIHNFAYLLEKILSSIPTLTVDTIVVQGKTGAEHQRLFKRIDWQLFVEEDEEGNLQAKYNYYDCLRNMCVYWGWSARTHGNTLYLLRIDDKEEEQTMMKLTRTALRSMAAGTSESGETVQMETRAITDQFANAENTDMQLRGPSKAIVTSDAGDAEGDIVKTFPDNLMYEMYEKGFDNSNVLYEYTYDILRFEHATMNGYCTNSASFNILRINATPYREYSYHPVIRIKDSYYGAEKAYLETTFSHTFYQGYFILKSTIYKGGEIFKNEQADTFENIGCKAMIMRLGIGETRNTAMWWNGAEWKTEICSFYAMIGADDGIIKTTPSVTEFASIYGRIPITSYNGGSATGKIYIDFFGSENIDKNEANRNFDIADFSVKFEREEYIYRYRDQNRHASREYKKETNNIGDEWTTESIFASDNYSKFGYGIVLDIDNKYYQGEFSIYGKPTIYSWYIQPEQQLADRVAEFWAKSKRKIECNLRTDMVEPTTKITPKSLLVIDGTTMYPVAISHAWRDDITNVSAIEILS